MTTGCPINHIDHVAIAVKDIYATIKVFDEIFGICLLYTSDAADE